MSEDYLRECLSEITNKVKKSVPIDQFVSEFCLYCINNRCSRSGSQKMSFEKRAKNWESDLFLNVPRADEKDSSYDIVRLKWFSPQSTTVINKQLESTSEQSNQVPQQSVPTFEQPETTELKSSDSEEKNLTTEQPKPEVHGGNTSWDSPEYINNESEEKTEKDSIIQPGGSFSF